MPQRALTRTLTTDSGAPVADDDFSQAGGPYRLLSEDEQPRPVAPGAGGLSQVSRDDVVEQNPAPFHAADPEYGRRVEEEVRAPGED